MRGPCGEPITTFDMAGGVVLSILVISAFFFGIKVIIAVGLLWAIARLIFVGGRR